MIPEQTLNQLKLALPQYLAIVGCTPNRSNRCRCPVHMGDSKTTAYIETQKGLVCGMPTVLRCDKCAQSWDIISLHAALHGLDAKRDFTKICLEIGEILGVHVEQPRAPTYTRRCDFTAEDLQPDNEAAKERARAYISECAKHIEGAAGYLEKRCISLETAKKFGLGYDEQTRRLIIPTGDGYNARATWDCEKGRYLKAKGLTPRGLGWDRIAAGHTVWIVEGEIDALSIIEAGHEAAGLGSAGAVHSLCNALAQMPDFKTNPPRLILSLDNDKTGQDKQAEFAEWLRAQGVLFYEAPPWTDAKDANEALCKLGKAAFGAILEQIEADFKDQKQLEQEAYAATNIYASLPSMWQAAQAADDAIKTGFHELDKLLGGGMRSGLYVFGAIPSLGKTALVLQIACDIAARGIDVLYFSLEMPKEDLVWRSVSRLTYSQDKTAGHTHSLSQRELQFTAWDKLGDRESAALNAYDTFARTTAQNLWIQDSIGGLDVETIGLAIAKHKDLRGQAPVVVIDYLQILKPIDPRMTDKAALDYNALRLKQLANQYHCTMMIISSFNRANYSTEAGFESFKESGAIEYCADCLFALQFKAAIDAKQAAKGADNQAQAVREAIKEAKTQPTRDIELVVLKNRMGQLTGNRGLFMQFMPQYNSFTDNPF